MARVFHPSWPFADRSTQMETSYSIDQRVPAIRLYPGRAGAANCKAVVTVEGTVPELGEDVDGDSVVLGLALNGQQYVDDITPIFQTMESILHRTILGPVRITEVTSRKTSSRRDSINIHHLTTREVLLRSSQRSPVVRDRKR